MKIYFSGSIRGGRDSQDVYPHIVRALEHYGTVFSKHTSDDTLSEYGETAVSAADIFEREGTELAQCDVVVAEVSTPSLGVGYIIAKARELKKPVIALYRGENALALSALIQGDENVSVFTYMDVKEVPELLQTALQKQ